MPISIVYDFAGETKSQIVSVQVIGPVTIVWMCFEHEGDYSDRFFQSKDISEEEFESLSNVLRALLANKQVPEWLSETFFEQISRY